jgi:RNA polymerase subunit RPABC4/transcription elongation factor Spt4
MTKYRRKEDKNEQWCPFCDEEIRNSQLPFCQPCRMAELHCPKCKGIVPRGEEKCPTCGTDITISATEAEV